MEENRIIKSDNNIIKRVGNVVSLTNKLITNTDVHLIPYRKKEKWGFCTPDKKIIIECIYDNIESLGNGHFYVILGNKCGVINKLGETIIPLIYSVLRKAREQLIAAKLNGKFGFLDINGKIVLPFIYDAATDFKDGKSIVDIDSHIFDLYKTGSTNSKVDEMYYYKIDDEGNLFRLSKTDSNRWWMIEKNYLPKSQSLKMWDYGKTIFGEIELQNEEILWSINGMTAFRKNGKYGFLGSDNIFVIPANYDDVIGYFEDGIIRVEINQKAGYINNNGFQYWED